MRLFVGAALLAGAMLFTGSTAFAQQHVNGYYRSNGTYVQPYYRSSPDNSYNNNWSVSPNVNPYTGQQGTHRPTWNDQPPTSGFGSAPSSGNSLYTNPYATQPSRNMYGR